MCHDGLAKTSPEKMGGKAQFHRLQSPMFAHAHGHVDTRILVESEFCTVLDCFNGHFGDVCLAEGQRGVRSPALLCLINPTSGRTPL